MESIRKLLKKNKTDEIDRLSKLPDGVISHILSYLSTKDAVKTSILSTTWKTHWKPVTNLDFSDCGYMEKAGFIKFVDQVLLQLTSSCLNKFCLPRFYYTPTDSNVSHLSSWISTALLHDVQHIDIRPYFRRTICFPPADLFMCHTLVILKLSGGLIEIPNSISLPNLKKLYLDGIIYDGKSCNRLISSSPVLEKLKLEHCVLTALPALKISSPRLKKFDLTADSCVDPAYAFELDAPQLAFFNLNFYIPKQGSLEKLHSLVHLYIDIEEVFGFKTKKPVFQKLKSFGYRMYEEISLMNDILECSPNLETFNLHFGGDSVYRDRNITPNLPKQLENVNIYYFDGQYREVALVNAILQNANALKELWIGWTTHSRRRSDESYDEKEDEFEDEIEADILDYPRASTSCNVDFGISE